MQRRRIRVFAILTMTSLALSGCNPKEVISISAVDHPNQTGGSLEISGSGFTPNNPVDVGITNAPGLNAPWHQAAGVAVGGNIHVTISYTHPGTANPLPGCQVGSADVVKLTVTATDHATHEFGTTTVPVANCGWATPQVTNHQ